MKKGERSKRGFLIVGVILVALAILLLLLKSSPPQIISASVYPLKIMPGQVMIVTVQAKDTLGIKSAVAVFDNEKMPDERNIPLITGTKRDGVYETRWIAHDTKNQAWYNTTIIFTDILGKKTKQEIEWQDPTVSHKADEITAGTFTGNYGFIGNITQIDNGVDSYTKLLLHMDGTNASTNFIDISRTPHTVWAQGQAHVETSQSKFGGASLRLDGTGDYLSLADSDDWAFGTGDFTIDTWVRFNSISDNQDLFGQYVDNNNFWVSNFNRDNGHLGMMFTVGGIYKGDYEFTFSPSINTWYHLAYVRNGINFYIFVNGVSQTLTVNTAFGTNDVGNLASVLYVGDMLYSSTHYYFNGWLDELRISKGIARWTSAFSVPTQQYDYYTTELGNLKYLGEDTTTRFKVISATRDVSLADGDVSYTGVGFKPKYIEIEAIVQDTKAVSTGSYDGTTHSVLFYTYDASNTLWYNRADLIIDLYVGSNSFATASVKSLDSDGITLTWNKYTSPTGTAVLVIKAYR
ncbi:MAG: LamG domain-containing protein [archaeon]